MERSDSMSESPRKRNGLLRDQVQLVKRKDTSRYEIAPFPEPLSFEKGFFVMIRAIQLLVQNNEGIIFAGVAGPSGAGKTVFTEKILNFMPSVAVISMDNYNDASRIVDGNFDDPRLTDYDTLLENIHGLKDGRSVQVPIYDFKTSCRTGYRTVDVPSSRIVIIEGIYALSDKLRPILDLRVSVTGGVHFDLVKRVLRDIQRAGQEPEEIIHQISETVYPMYKAFIEPDLKTAHIRIINKFNPFSGFQNPMYILKSPRSLTPDQIKAALGEDQTESNEETYDIYLLPPGEDPEACQSYLRMRNREGKYNLMFEEWVTDNPFIISPRITFEVSVRLLGGLMALGYTIAAILKRSSRVFSDGKATVKIDWLEQLNRRYIQVQGRDRLYVKFVAEQLGLDGSYIPRTYIEQIQLEKLMNDVMALPDDLRTKLSIDDELVSSPKEVDLKDATDYEAGFIAKHRSILLVDRQHERGHKFTVSKAIWYPVDTGLFVTASFDNYVKVWDTNSTQVVMDFKMPGKVYSAAMSPIATTHMLIATGSADVQVRLCDIASGAFTHTLSGHHDGIMSLEWSTSSEWILISGGFDGAIRFWDIRRAGCFLVLDQLRSQLGRRPPILDSTTDKDQKNLGPSPSSKSCSVQQRTGNRKKQSKALHKSQTMVRGHMQQRVHPGMSSSQNHKTAHYGAVTGLRTTTDGMHLLSSGSDSRLRLWDIDSGCNTLVNFEAMRLQTSKPLQLAVTDDPSLVFIPCMSSIKAYNTWSGTTFQTFRGHYDHVNCCYYNSQDQELYTGSNDRQILVWSPSTPAFTEMEDDEKWQEGFAVDEDNWSD